MVKRCHRVLWVGAIGCVLLSGCQTSTRLADTVAPTSASNPFLGALQANRAGRVWNDGLRAAQHGNAGDLAGSAEELRRLGATSEADLLTFAAAEGHVRAAINFDTQAREAQGARKAELEKKANARYREALRLSPDFSSRDPNSLNALGYFLADRGTSHADYILAEKLTRRALQRWGEIKSTPLLKANLQFARANTRDSLAWALYKQKRYAEALREQVQALKDAQEASKQLGSAATNDSLQELRSHLQDIQKANQRSASER